MTENIVKIAKRESDLVDYGESLFLASYEERKQEIYDYIVNSQGYPPSQCIIYVREITFPIPDNKTILHLQSLSSEIKEKFVIDCFQMSIDRANGEAHMQFDWYNRQEHKSVHLYETLYLSLSAMIIQRLNIDVKDNNIRNLRFHLLADYTYDAKVFDKLDMWVKHQKPNLQNYRVIKNALRYVQLKCQGLVK